MNTATSTILPGEDAVELGELLGFLHDWLADPNAAVSLRRFTLGLIRVDEIRSDLVRFAFALGVEIPLDDGDNDKGDEW